MIFSPTTLSNDLNNLLDAAVKAKREAEPRRPYLGASAIGRECERELAYSYHVTPKDAAAGFSGRLFRIFDKGHDGETRMAEYLRAAGFDLLTEKEDGRQFGFAAAEGRIKGHVDGIFLSGPLNDIPYPCGWETKELNNKSWGDTAKKGVEVSKPVYYAQVQILSAYMDLPGFLFTAVNKDSAEVYAEWIPVKLAVGQALSDKAVRIVSSGSPEELPRITKDPQDFRCAYCDYQLTCWKKEDKPATTTAAPAWLKKI